MSVTSLVRSLYWPAHEGYSLTATTLDAANEKVAWILQAPASGSLTEIVFRTGTKTAGSNDWAITVGLQGVDATTGYPDGTWKGGAAPTCTKTYTSAALASNTTYVAVLDEALTVTRGTDLLAVVVEMTTFVTSGSIIISSNNPTVWTPNIKTFPYVYTKLGGTDHKDGNQSLLCGLKIDSTYYGTPPYTNSALELKTNGTISEVGNVFTLPWGCTADGIWCHFNTVANDIELVLYEVGNSTPLQTITIDKDILTLYLSMGHYLFSTQQTLQANTAYRVTMKATTTTSQNINLNKKTYASTDVQSFAPGGSTVYGSSRLTTGSWTDAALDRYPIGLILDGIDIPAGSGGGSGIIRSNLNRTGVIQ